jgi:hypothetical protein
VIVREALLKAVEDEFEADIELVGEVPPSPHRRA